MEVQLDVLALFEQDISFSFMVKERKHYIVVVTSEAGEGVVVTMEAKKGEEWSPKFTSE